MADTSATIIDFSAYKANKRASAQQPRRVPYSSTLDGELLSFYFFWPFLAWIAVSWLDPATSELERS